jgi:hypothetical protein
VVPLRKRGKEKSLIDEIIIFALRTIVTSEKHHSQFVYSLWKLPEILRRVPPAGTRKTVIVLLPFFSLR